MKKGKKIIVLILIIILSSTLTLTVKAADAIVKLNPSSTQITTGDTFTITLNASCEEGINGIEGNISYDTNKLELVSLEVTDTSKWVNLGEELNFAILYNSSEETKTSDILKITLKAKETAELGETKITVSDIMLDSNATTNSNKKIGIKEVGVTIKEKEAEQEPNIPNGEKALSKIEITEAPRKTTYIVGEKFETERMKVIAVYNDGSKKEIKNYTVKNGEKISKGQTSITVSYTEGKVTKTAEQKITVVENANDGSNNQNTNNISTNKTNKDNTITDKKIPYTGIMNYVIYGIIITLVLAMVSYISYRKNKLN